jgi:uncharacterized membrane protein SirB2
MLAEHYVMFKHLHMTFAVISIFLFVFRFCLLEFKVGWVTARWLKIVPHVNDTLLLVFAIVLSMTIQQYPFSNGWLTEKLILLVVYILFGFYALKLGKTATVKRIAFVLAVATFALILYVARTKTPLLLG